MLEKSRFSLPQRRLHLDRVQVYDRVSDMKLSTRSLMREFPKAKAAARKGQAVEIVDGNRQASGSS